MTANPNHSRAAPARAVRSLKTIAAAIIATTLLGSNAVTAADRVQDKDVDFGADNTTLLELHSKDCVLREENKVPAVLEIGANDQMTVDGTPTDKSGLIGRLPPPGNCQEKNPKVTVVYVKPDYCVSYDTVAKTLALIKNAGYQIAVVNPKKESGSNPSCGSQ